MGLLTDAKARNAVGLFLVKYSNKLCLFSYLIGFAWFCALAHTEFNAGTYISENALLPGLVEEYFDNVNGADTFLNAYSEEMTKIKKDSNKEEARFHMPVDWFAQQFSSLGLDVFVQNFSFTYPGDILQGKTLSGQNMYAILRAPRTASTEGLVVSAPYRPPDTTTDSTIGGIALMYALANAFRGRSYWAKDLVFLITEHEDLGMHAWLTAYHQVSSKYIVGDDLFGRAGSIQAALNLEIPSAKVSSFNLKLEGLNGQMPNLDLVNTVVRIARKTGIELMLHKRGDRFSSSVVKETLYNMCTLLRGMGQQATGAPSGGHGLFHQFNIEALTIQGLQNTGITRRRQFGFVEMGRVLEGILRSLNNLLERFHQSFFFYLLPSTSRYISIGLYMPPFGLIAAPILIKSLDILVQISRTSDDGLKTAEVYGRQDFLVLLPLFIMVFLFGLGALMGPAFFLSFARPFQMAPADAIGWGALALLIASFIFPRILAAKTQSRRIDRRMPAKPLKAVTLVLLSSILGPLGIINISLAILISFVWVPAFLLVGPRSSRLLNWIQTLVMPVFSPLGLLYVAAFSHSVADESSFQFAKIHLQAWGKTKHWLLLGVLDGDMFGNWTYGLIACTLYPCWLLLLASLWTIPSPTLRSESHDKNE